jgi:hypothetical protein
LARELLESNVEDQDIDFMDLSPQRRGRPVGRRVLPRRPLPLAHPFVALEKVASVTREMAIVSTSVDTMSHE